MKIIVKLGIGATIVAAILCGVIYFLGRAYKNEIIASVLETVAKSNQIELQEEKIDLNVFYNFPFSRISFENVHITQKQNTASNIQFEAKVEEMQIHINLFKFIIDNELEVHKVLLKKGAVNIDLLSDKLGEKSSQNQEKDKWLMEIEQFEIQDLLLKVNKNKFNIATALLKVSKTEKEWFFSTKSDFFIEEWTGTKETSFLNERIKISAEISLCEEEIKIIDGKISVASHNISVSGNVGPEKIRINAGLKHGKIEKIAQLCSLYSLIPDLEDAKGTISADIKLEGSRTNKGNIKLEGSGSINNAKLRIRKQEEIQVKTAKVFIHSNNINNSKSYICNITEAEILSSGIEASGEAKVYDFATPHIEINTQFRASLEALKKDCGGDVSGTLHIKTHGTKAEDIEALSGDLQLEKVSFVHEKKPYNIDGKLKVEKNLLRSQVKISCGYGAGFFDGSIQNYFALTQENSKEAINIAGKLKANFIEVDSILGIGASEQNGSNISLRLKVENDTLMLFNEQYINSSFSLVYNNRGIVIDKIKSEGFGGILNGTIEIYEGKRHKNFDCDVYFNDIKIDKISSFNNMFNIKKGSLQGDVSGRIAMEAPLLATGLDTKQMEAKIEIAIENGKMHNFEPVLKLSKYLKRELLEEVRFSALKNTITIQQETITIPKMEIRSSALNSFIGGKHQFNGDFEYKITLFLTELLWSKAQDLENPIKEGKTKLFLKAKQKNDKFSIAYDTEEWGKNFQEKLKQEATSFSEAKSKEAAREMNKQKAIRIESDLIEEPAPSAKPAEPKKKKEQENPSSNVEGKKKPNEKPAVQIEWDE